jgi:hypothetical protein
LTKVFSAYQKEAEKLWKDTVGINAFRDILKAKGLAIFKPKEDQFVVFITYKLGNSNEEANQWHLTRKEHARSPKKKEKDNASKISGRIVVETNDFYSTLLCP